MASVPIGSNATEFAFLMRRLQEIVPLDIEAMALQLVGRDPHEAMNDLDRNCQEIAHAIVQMHGTPVDLARIIGDCLGRLVIARANAMTAMAGVNLTETTQ